MAFSTPIQTNFSSGEISPIAQARVDAERYYSAAKLIENMIVLPQGGVTRRPGTKYLGNTEYDNKRSLLIPFTYSTEQAYVIEVGDLYFKFWKNQGLLLGGVNKVTNGSFDTSISGWTVDVVSPYTVSWSSLYKSAAIETTSPTNTSQYGKMRQQITLTASTEYQVSFYCGNTFSPFNLNNVKCYCKIYGSTGGSTEVNINNIKNDNVSFLIDSDDYTGNVYIEFGILTLSLFQSSLFGDGLYIDDVQVIDTVTPTKVTTPYTEADIDQLQFCQSADEMYFVHPDFPPKVLTRTTPSSFTLTNITFTATPSDWASNNYPGAISFFEQRLCFSGVPSNPRRVYCSKTADYFNFTVGTDADSPIIVDCTDNQVNAISWLYPRTSLLVGTSSGIGTFGSNTNYDSITPTNIKYNPESSDRTGSLIPKRMGQFLVCTDAYDKYVTSVSYDENGNITTDSLMSLAEHFTADSTIIDYAFQSLPYPILWCVLSDGSIISLTFKPEMGTIAWASHETNGTFESVCVIPSTTGSNNDEVYFVVRRLLPTIKRYIEKFTDQFDINRNTEQYNLVYLDSSISETFDNPVTTISGLDHLTGLSVYALADGVVQGPFTVSPTGSITLTTSATVVTIGLQYTPILKPVNYNSGSPLGTAEGKLKRISEVSLRLFRSSEFTIARNGSPAYTQIANRTQYTGIHRFSDFPGDYDMDTDITILQTKPYPLTVLSIIPTMVTQERN